ncbi:hypothetical protein Tco_0584429 [Tanacetum coccineum]
MAEIVSKEAKKKSKAGICFMTSPHKNKHSWFLSLQRSNKLQCGRLRAIIEFFACALVLKLVVYDNNNNNKFLRILLKLPKIRMVYRKTMAELLQAPTEGYEDAIVVPEIEAANFEIKHGLLTLVQNKQFFGHDKEDPHAQLLLLQ